MNWGVIVDNDAKKFLKKIPESDVFRITRALEEFISDPFLHDIQKMKGEKNVWRRRIGSYRIFYEIFEDKRIVYVFSIKRRGSNTY